MISVKPLLLSAAIATTSRRALNLNSAVAMSTSSTSQSCANGKSALIFMHGLGGELNFWFITSEIAAAEENYPPPPLPAAAAVASHTALRLTSGVVVSSGKWPLACRHDNQLPSIRKNLGEKNVHYVFPPAPTIGITINGGMEMPGWFDLFDWPIGISARDDRDGKLAAAQQIESTVEKLEREMGIPASRIVVGGFSQGGAVALLTAYHRRTKGKEPFAGCVCLSGWLTMKDELAVTPEVAKGTPLFWGHGQWDDKVLFEQQAHGVEKLRSLGVDVTDSSYPVGHSSHPKEVEAMAEFIESALTP
ncbi:hypothetical protein ACHAWF_000900 [Thalassiosira exigua]